RSMDHNSYALASAWWRRLLTDPVHRDRIRPLQRLKAAYCYARSGQSTLAETLARELDGDVTIAGRPVRADHWLSQQSLPVSQILAATTVPVVGGSADRNGIARGSAPLLRHPVWTVS